MKNINNKLQIIIPTINSANYIEEILLYYKKNNFDVIVFVDTKSSDQTRLVAKKLFNVFDLDNSTSYIENSIGAISDAVDSEWILRIDDDELPSLSMMNFVHEIVSDNSGMGIDVVGFPRHQCLVSMHGKLIVHKGHDAFHSHRQWRLYRRSQVSYRKNLHTPGFQWNDESRCRAAPDDACMIHLDWVVHDYTERRDKLQRYAAIEPGVDLRDGYYYLVEENGVGEGDLGLLHLPEFNDTIRDLSSKARARRYAAWNWTLGDSASPVKI